MEQSYAVYITGGVWPLDNGARLHSYGLCNEFSKAINLKIFSFASDVDRCSKECDLEGNVECYFHDNPRRNMGFQRDIQIIAMMSCSQFLYADWIKKIEAEVLKPECKFIIIDQISMYAYYLYFKKKYPDKKYIYISHNVEYINLYEKYFVVNRKFHFELNQEYVKKIFFYRARKSAEKDLIEHCDYVFAISPDDMEQFSKSFNVKGKMLFAKPLIKFQTVKTLDDMNEYNFNLVFIGSMYWYPNVNGITWFVGNVFEKLIDYNPSYKLYIVGRNPDSSLLEIQKRYPDNIIVTGEVDDIKEYYAIGNISIIPLFEGMGTKIKVLESIASGIPTVCTSFAANAYKITDELLLADTSEDFYNAIISIEKSVDKRKELYKKMDKYYTEYMHMDSEIEVVLKNV